MKVKKTSFLLIVVGIFLITSCVAYSVTWSNPSVIRDEPTPAPVLRDVSHSEWNQVFADWKSGEVSKEDTIKILKGVRRV